jgi:hypothetical protein
MCVCLILFLGECVDSSAGGFKLKEVRKEGRKEGRKKTARVVVVKLS